MFKKLIRKKHRGFMAKTHAFLSVILMTICMMLPLPFFQKTFWVLKDDILLFIVALVTLVGGALLPDLDNSVSKAGYTLGPLCGLITTFMQTTSAIVWNVYHKKGDKKPLNQHRFLWHTSIVGLGFILLFYYGLPPGEYTILTNIQSSIETNQLANFIKSNAILSLFIFMSFLTSLVGSNIILQHINKLISVPKLVKYILPVFTLLYIFTADYSTLRILGVCLGAGYLFHVIEDGFADSGVPLMFPIPAWWKNQVWYKVRLIPITVTTGGTINTIIDFISFIVAILMICIVFTTK